MPKAAYINVNPPTRPKNIKMIKINLDAIPSVGVIPSVSPTVPTADAVSKRQDVIGRFSIALIAIPPNKNRVMYIINIAEAVLTVPSSTLRLISSALSFFLNTEKAEENR